MPGVIDPQTIEVNHLPVIWSPIQSPLAEDERVRELDLQATASLLWAATIPEQILRLLLSETDIEAIAEPPPGYDPAAQGEWDSSQLTFAFARQIRLIREERRLDRLTLEYKVDGAGTWLVEFGHEELAVARI